MWSEPNDQTGMDLFLKYPHYRDPILLNLIFKNVEYLSKYVSKVAHWDLSRKMNEICMTLVSWGCGLRES